jgi:hypothetical protein
MEALRAHSSVWPFLDPVPREEVPDYYDVIKFAIVRSARARDASCVSAQRSNRFVNDSKTS